MGYKMSYVSEFLEDNIPDDREISTFKVSTKMFTREEMRQKYIDQRRELLRKRLTIAARPMSAGRFNVLEVEPCDVFQTLADIDERERYEVNTLTSMKYAFLEEAVDPTLGCLLKDTSHDLRGPETPVDAFGRTALMATVDPEYFSKLNDSEMSVLHGLENLEDLIYSDCSWETPDKRGRKPKDVCPFWLKKIFVSIHQNRQRQKNEQEWE